MGQSGGSVSGSLGLGHLVTSIHPGAGDRSSKAFEKKRQGHQGYSGGEDVAKF